MTESVLHHRNGFDTHGHVISMPGGLPEMTPVPELRELLSFSRAVFPGLRVRLVQHRAPEPPAANGNVQHQVKLKQR